jgi:hypothetical protein
VAARERPKGSVRRKWVPTAHGPTGTGLPRRAGQGKTAAVRGARRRARRARARSAPIEFHLAMFDCQKLDFSKHKWTKLSTAKL